MLKVRNYALTKPEALDLKGLQTLIVQSGGTVFHEYAFNAVVEKHFGSEFFFLVDGAEGTQVACPVHRFRKQLGATEYFMKPPGDVPYGGFVGDVAIEGADLVAGPLDAVYYHGSPKEKVSDKEAENCPGLTSMVDLSLDEDEIFNSCIHSKRRNMIRKALKCGVEVKQFDSESGLVEFWPMLKALHDRLGYSRYTYDYYRDLLNSHGPRKKAFVLVAYLEGKAISGVMVIGNKNYMHYYKGASLFGVKNIGQGELLQWEAIKTSKALGSSFYDLCNLEKDKLPAIYRFKTGISNSLYGYPVYKKKQTGFKILNRVQALIQ